MSKKKPHRKTRQAEIGRARPEAIPEVPPFDRRTLEATMSRMLGGAPATSSAVADAQEIMYDAFEEIDPRRQVALAHQALEVSRDCADAYVLLAGYAPTLAERLELLEEGVAAGARALGKQGFKEFEGHFWGVLETRPYMRAREGLIDGLWEFGRRDEAAEHCREMLQLNPNDNQGIRYRLASMLLDLEQHDELERLLQQYDEDGSADWAYARALLAFRREGDSANAQQRLRDAERTNAHVPLYLAGARMMPRELPDYVTRGGEDEAASCAAQLLRAWKETPGAIPWLRKTLKIALPAAHATSPHERNSWSTIRRAIGALPQRADEAWEVDLRPMGAAPQNRGDGPAPWLMLVQSTESRSPVALEFFDSRPSDREAWNVLVDALLEPEQGEPSRPAAVCVVRKSWLRSWNAKLQQVGVECRLNESLELIDRWMVELAPQLEAAQRMAKETAPEEQDWHRAVDFPQQADEVWQAAVQQLPAWIAVAGEPTRPWVALVADVESSALLATSVMPGEPGDEGLPSCVWQALSRPSMGEPHRPGVIQVASEQERALLAERLEGAGVRCVVNSDMHQIRQLIDDLADHLAEPQRRAALVDSPGATPAQIGALFAAAADYYRRRPWRLIRGDSVIRIACDRFESSPWYAVVMGQSGVEQGLVLYDDLDVLRDLLSGALSDEASGNRTSALSITYGEAFETSPQDVDAAEEYGWPVAGPEAYPCVLRVEPGLAVRTPLQGELELLEGCLRAIPAFLEQSARTARIPTEAAGNAIEMSLERMDNEA